MNKAKFWLIQITMLAIVSLAFGPTAISAPKSKSAKTITADITDEFETHGEEMRLDKANLEEGNADWKTEDTTPPDLVPVCTSSDTSGCTVENCGPSSGSWNDSAEVCSFF
jgi:hypothetical protein